MTRFLALGDSYTIGEGVTGDDRWPVQLVGLLRARDIQVAPPEIIATTGWTTDELAAGIAAAHPRGPYRLVTLLIGVNDQYRGRRAADFAPAHAALLASAVALAGGRPAGVVCVSIPDWGVTPFAKDRDAAAIAREIDAHNAVAERQARAAGAGWVDVTSDSRRHPADLVADGLHPSGAAYRRWAGAILPAALAALGAP